MPTIKATRAVGQLVVERPSRAQFFDQLGIDYCCHGGIPLSNACAERGLDLGHVLRKLEDCDRQDAAAQSGELEASSLSSLVDRIVAVHHGHLRRELPRLVALIERVSDAHGWRHPELGEIREVFAGLKSDLESHMLREEWAVFPQIKRLDEARSIHDLSGGIVESLHDIVAEHTGFARALARFRKLTDEYRTPPDACETYRALLGGLAGLEVDLHQHVHEENNVLFPRALRRLAAVRSSTRH
jgi:regulator of cell morphogenesis and NO signaling